MIRSITEEEMVHISIEKIYKKDAQGNESLITVNENIYSNLMDLPSRDEWLDVIRNLPKDKATDPSGISNEMLQHLSPTAHDILYYLICKIIQFGYLPKQWKKATVFSIAKPKPFNYELSNSRLITLLETACKVFITLLNRQLTITIVNKIIQDAIDNNNELWILSQRPMTVSIPSNYQK
ncbi:hypothetical protein RclHR1_33130001 [Rhizophagus clarus]|uniref:Reverse transcriptase domain-containing protein n=1 Tax=Rhizophagus clarus TaxID=94130 RepID=A0A2Z6S382_9GLOM|nr:hypothetical protein RclHR1_33130001 [Rhizophagus clarus]